MLSGSGEDPCSQERRLGRAARMPRLLPFSLLSGMMSATGVCMGVVVMEDDS